MEIDYEKLFKRAKAFGVKRGLGNEEAQDFAQECLIKAFEVGPINLEFVFLNYRNALRAHKRMLSTSEGKLSGARIISFDAPIDSSDNDSAKLGDYYGSVDGVLERVGEDFFTDALVGRTRGRTNQIVVGMIEEKTNKELGSELGLTESRVFQLSKRIKEVCLILRLLPKSSLNWAIDHAL